MQVSIVIWHTLTIIRIPHNHGQNNTKHTHPPKTNFIIKRFQVFNSLPYDYMLIVAVCFVLFNGTWYPVRTWFHKHSQELFEQIKFWSHRLRENPLWPMYKEPTIKWNERLVQKLSHDVVVKYAVDIRLSIKFSYCILHIHFTKYTILCPRSIGFPLFCTNTLLAFRSTVKVSLSADNSTFPSATSPPNTGILRGPPLMSS